MPPNGMDGTVDCRPDWTTPIVFDKRRRLGVVSMLFLSMVSHRTLLKLSCLLFSIHLVRWVSQLSVDGMTLGNAAQVWSVWPPTMQAATPKVAVFANKVEALSFSNVLEIAFSRADFPIPPWPWTIINHWGEFLPQRNDWRCVVTVLCTICWQVFNNSCSVSFWTLSGHCMFTTLGLITVDDAWASLTESPIGSSSSGSSMTSSSLVQSALSHTWNWWSCWGMAVGATGLWGTLAVLSLRAPVSHPILIAVSVYSSLPTQMVYQKLEGRPLLIWNPQTRILLQVQCSWSWLHGLFQHWNSPFWCHLLSLNSLFLLLQCDEIVRVHSIHGKTWCSGWCCVCHSRRWRERSRVWNERIVVTFDVCDRPPRLEECKHTSVK